MRQCCCHMKSDHNRTQLQISACITVLRRYNDFIFIAFKILFSTITVDGRLCHCNLYHISIRHLFYFLHQNSFAWLGITFLTFKSNNLFQSSFSSLLSSITLQSGVRSPMIAVPSSVIYVTLSFEWLGVAIIVPPNFFSSRYVFISSIEMNLIFSKSIFLYPA